MKNPEPIVMEARGKGLWRFRKNPTGQPLSTRKRIHVAGSCYREVSTRPTVLELLRAAAAGRSLDGGLEPFTPSTREQARNCHLSGPTPSGGAAGGALVDVEKLVSGRGSFMARNAWNGSSITFGRK
jgi:hypothetical protein